MMALATPNVEVLGITCSHGNSSLENTCRNTLRVLKACGRLDGGDTWLAQGTDKARFMERIFRYTIEIAKTEPFKREMVAEWGFTSCDSYAMAAAIDDSVITESEQDVVTVELSGTHTRGMMVVDKLKLLPKKAKANIMKKVDLDKFKKMLMDTLK